MDFLLDRQTNHGITISTTLISVDHAQYEIFHANVSDFSELQIRGSYEDNSKIIFLIFQRKHML